MDLLTDLLRQAGLRRRLLDLRQLGTDAALRFPCDKSIGLHVVTRGPVYLHIPHLGAPQRLATGEVALMARGCPHLLSAGPGYEREHMVSMSGQGPLIESATIDATQPAVISGAYQLWNRPLHPFFDELPPWHVLRASELHRLGPLATTLAMLDDEVQRRALGADLVLHGLLDVIFTWLLRSLLEREAASAGRWAHAASDPQVSRAIALMHTDCAKPWTLAELAASSGLSRTALAGRFRQALGDTPMSYLRTVRMQKAMQLLAESDWSLERVATEVGYQDAFTFSKVFKRQTGSSPRDFRRRDAQERQQAGRI